MNDRSYDRGKTFFTPRVKKLVADSATYAQYQHVWTRDDHERMVEEFAQFAIDMERRITDLLRQQRSMF